MPVGVGDAVTVGARDLDKVTLSDRGGLPEVVADPEPVTDPVGDIEPVTDPVGDVDPDTDPEGDKGTMPYEIENTGLPPAPAIGTAVGKTIVRVAFC